MRRFGDETQLLELPYQATLNIGRHTEMYPVKKLEKGGLNECGLTWFLK